jgi:hypothetical protein
MIVVDEGFRAGMVCRERKGEQARDLLTSPCVPHIGFDLRQRDPPDIPGLHKNRYRKGRPACPNNRCGARRIGSEISSSRATDQVLLPKGRDGHN